MRSAPPRLVFAGVAFAAALLGAGAVPAPAFAAAGPAAAWCAPELDALPGNVCHFDGSEPGGRRTLVILLHGLIARNTTWQWTQERAIARDARQFHFTAIVPQAPAVGPGGSGGYAWPGGAPKPGAEDELAAGWMRAKKLLEERAGKPFDDVFVLGFSSGAYYASQLALRGALDVDGYGVFAGGTGGSSAAATKDAARRAPIFVGVCGRDKATAPDGRALGAALAALSWPHKVDELAIGHMFGDVHIGHAVAYLRARHDAARASK